MGKNKLKKIEIKRKYVYTTFTDGTVCKHPKHATDVSVELRQPKVQPLIQKFPITLNDIII